MMAMMSTFASALPFVLALGLLGVVFAVVTHSRRSPQGGARQGRRDAVAGTGADDGASMAPNHHFLETHSSDADGDGASDGGGDGGSGGGDGGGD